jgi:diguanylate cyclase (GGDEF)-like protein
MDTRPHASPAFLDAVASDLKPVAVTRWTAKLADPECEQDFRRYRLADDRRRAVILLLLVSVASAFNFLIELARYIENGTEFLRLVPSSTSIWLPLVVLMVVRRINSPISLEIVMIASGVVGALTRLALLTLQPPEIAMWSTMAVAMILIVYLYMPVRFVTSIAMTVVLSIFALSWWFATAQGKVPPEAMARGFLWVVLANALGFIAANSLQRSLRIQFAQGLLLQRLLSTDSLTNIANRRRFDDMFAREWRRCERAGAPLSLLMIDVDHFKAYNDHSGHVQGDEALRQVAKLLCTAAKRPGDLVARYGGEEFICLLPAIGVGGARAVANRLIEAVRQANILHPCSPSGPRLTISVGSATASDLSGNPLELIAFADKLLYAAKAAGRDQVMVGQLTPAVAVRAA